MLSSSVLKGFFFLIILRAAESDFSAVICPCASFLKVITAICRTTGSEGAKKTVLSRKND